MKGKIVTVEEDLNGRFYRTTKFPIKRDGKPVYLAGYTIDITEQKNAERSLIESEKRHRIIAEMGSEYLFRLSVKEDGNVIMDYVSDNYTAVTGRTREKAETVESWNDIIHPDDIQKLLALLDELLKKPGSANFECRSFLPNGSERMLNVVAKSEWDPESRRVTEIIGGVQDITERKKYENVLRNMQKLESIGVLAGGIAHDFNNLMGGIYGNIDMACRLNKNEGISVYLENAMRTLDRTRSLTQQLLTFAKGGVPVMKPGLLFPYLEETVHFALSGSNCLARFDIDQDLWPSRFDRNQIGQVFDNIIINAQQAMPFGGDMHVSARNIVLEHDEHPFLMKGDYVKISVRDSGIGMTKDVVARIFDPFFTTKKKGHGLGLAICSSIIKKHGGYIDADSAPGRGSVFTVYLPACTDGIPSSEDKPDKSHCGSGRILVMDDEEVMRETIRVMVESFGYSVISSDNGQEALGLFLSETEEGRGFAGIILDLTVPGGMGGKEAVREIRKVDGEIPVFVASGYSDDPVVKEPLEFGFTASICKPFIIKELAGIFEKYIKKGSKPEKQV